MQDTVGEARVLTTRQLHNSTDEAQRALETYNQVLEIWRARKDMRLEGDTLRSIGAAHLALKNHALALDYLNNLFNCTRGSNTPQR